ncbi:MAG: phosphate uptake regulator PhoU [Candidatus Caldarchaeum sp.]
MELKRSVQFTGGSSYTVTLPKNWVKRMGIKKGSLVSIKPTEDGGILLYPEKIELKQESEVEIVLGPHVGQMIVGAYLYGYNLIKIKSPTPMTDEELAEVKKVVRGLAGAEIVDETPAKIEVQVVLDKELVAPEKMLRRQHTLVLGMLENAVDALVKKNLSLAKLAAQSDEEVDRLYFTLVRVIRSAVIDPVLAKKLNTSPLTLLDLRVAAKFIEDAGDQASEIAKVAVKANKEFNDDVLKELKTLAGLILSMEAGPLDALFSRDIEKIARITGIRSEFLKRGDLFLRKTPYTPNTFATFKIYSHLAKICEDFSDIAELGLPLKTA